jgi:hypothetical protein
MLVDFVDSAAREWWVTVAPQTPGTIEGPSASEGDKEVPACYDAGLPVPGAVATEKHRTSIDNCSCLVS